MYCYYMFQVIICTDGLANVGVGSLDGTLLGIHVLHSLIWIMHNRQNWTEDC